MQSQRLSRWEVGIDFVFSIAINLGTQAIFLHSFTLQRGVGFTAVFLTLALLRRYLVRRGFNLLVAPGMGQSRQMSLVEVTTDTVLAVTMAFGLVLLWYPGEPVPRISGLILASYVLTLARRYVMRRLFEWFAYVPSSYGSDHLLRPASQPDQEQNHVRCASLCRADTRDVLYSRRHQ